MVIGTEQLPDYEQFSDLWKQAQRQATGFINPRRLNVFQEVYSRRGDDWVIAVMGKPWRGLGGHTQAECELLVLADQAGINPPLPAHVVQARAEYARREHERREQRRRWQQTEQQRWDVARTQTTVPLEVRLNTTTRVRHGHAEQLGHAVPTVDAYSRTGRRTRRHRAGRALCETEHRTTPLALSTVTTKYPVTCKRCLSWTPKVFLPAAPGT